MKEIYTVRVNYWRCWIRVAKEKYCSLTLQEGWEWRQKKCLGHHCYLVRTLWSLETYLKNNPWFVGCSLAAGTALLAPPVVAVCQVISLFKYEKIDPILSVVHKNWLPGWYILKLTGSLATNHKKIRFVSSMVWKTRINASRPPLRGDLLTV